MKRWQLLYYIHHGTFVGFFVMTFIQPIYESIKIHSRVLPLPGCYPFDDYKTPTYQFFYIYETFFAFYLIFQTSNAIHFFIAILFLAFSECDVLCDQLRNLKKENGESDRETEAKLVDCIKLHRKIHRLSKEVEKCFSFVIFAMYSGNSITFCLVLYKLLHVDFFSAEFFAVVMYQLTLLIEIYLYCWLGSNLTHKSENIRLAAYECDWTGASKSFKSTLLIFLQNTLKPFELNLILFPLSLDKFVQLMKTAFSYYTFLKTMSGE